MATPRGVLAAACVAVAALGVVHHRANRHAHVTFSRGGSRAHVSRVYVITPQEATPTSTARMKMVSEYLSGVPFDIVHPNASLAPQCSGSTLTPRHFMCMTAQLNAINRVVRDTQSADDDYHVIFEDDMCPGSKISSQLVRALELVLGQADKNALAVNLGPCSGRRLSDAAQALVVSADCQLLDGYGPCMHAWATTRRHAPRLLEIFHSSDMCTLPLDMILPADHNKHQRVFCPYMGRGRDDTTSMFVHNMFHQCGGSSVIHGVLPT